MSLMQVALMLVCLGTKTISLNKEHYYLRWEAILKLASQNDDVNDVSTTTTQPTNELGITFTCDVTDPKKRATSVHELRPSDVSVVAAMGDSVTAGNGLGAANLVDVLTQNRGESWSIGGDLSLEEDVITFANVLKKFNPDVKGFSQGKGGADNDGAGLNVAIPGATAEDIPAQADELVTRLRADDSIDMDADWKVVTLFVGANDLCASCMDTERYSPEIYGKHLQDALDRLHADVPRMLVNLVPMFDVTPLNNLSTGFICNTLHLLECSCAVKEEDSPEIRSTQLAYYKKMHDLATSGRYNSRDDFGVVLQPSLVDFRPPRDASGEFDKTWLSYDCFHPERKGHQLMALTLWNTMFLPVDEKPLTPAVDPRHMTFTCPTQEAPFFATNKKHIIAEDIASLQNKMTQQKEVRHEDQASEQSGHSLTVLGALFVSCVLLGLVFISIKFVIRSGKLSRQGAPPDRKGKYGSNCETGFSL